MRGENIHTAYNNHNGVEMFYCGVQKLLDDVGLWLIICFKIKDIKTQLNATRNHLLKKVM